MISGPVVVQVLEGENAILKNREVMGATNPANAAPGTIRKEFALNIGENSVHGSDAPETAARGDQVLLHRRRDRRLASRAGGDAGLHFFGEGESHMPYVRIEITDGATYEQKLQLYKETTEMLVRVLNKKPEYTFVVIEEVDNKNWGHMGTSVHEIRMAQAAGGHIRPWVRSSTAESPW